MNKQSREALDAYYMEAQSWGHDRQEAMHNGRRTAWIIAGGAAAIAILEALALIFMMPLKRVEPHVLMVDRHTGFVQALNPLNPARISADTALTQSFLVQYVTAREGYDIDTIQANYRKVALWSAERARTDYLARIPASNPQSPLNLYPRSTVVETRVKSVSPVAPNVAMVRFDTRRHDAGGQIGPPRAWVAVIRYRYSGAPMRVEDRFVNPLGFEVLRYRVDAEALPQEADVIVAPPPSTLKIQVPAAPTRPAPGQAAPARPVAPEPEL
ncbi:MAG TPA: type IV secretion system protein [Allosphingosinicella sp.]